MNKTIVMTLILLVISCKTENKKKEPKVERGKIEFKWDFSENKSYIYSYTLNIISEHSFEKGKPSQKIKSIGKGQLLVKVKNEDIANVNIKDLKMDMISFDKNGKIKDTLSDSSPNIMVQGLRPNGTFENQNHNSTFDLLFSLPPDYLKIGESSKRFIQLPYNANGSSLNARGFNDLTYKKNQTQDGKQCAILVSKLDISELGLEKDLIDKYKYQTNGKGTYCFDLEKGCLIYANIDINIEHKIDTEADSQDDNGMYSASTEIGNVKIDLSSRNTIKFF